MWLGELTLMTKAVDWDVKQQSKQKELDEKILKIVSEYDQEIPQ